MNIIKFTAQKTKNLKAVEITPEGDVVVLSGKNGQGKSNILNVIMSTLTGVRLEDPILHGADKAESFIDLGDYKIRKRWTQKGEYLEVLTKDGDKKASPQTFLDTLVGKISFDPLEFCEMKPTDQRDLLKNLVGLDFSDIEKESQQIREDRTAVNSEIKGIIAQINTSTAPDPKTPDDEIMFKDELEKLNELRGKRKAFTDLRTVKEGAEEIIRDAEGEIKEWKKQIQEIEGWISAKTAFIKKTTEEKDSIVLPPEVTENEITAVEASLSDIENKNVAIRAAKRYRQLLKDGEKLKQKSDKFNEALKRLEQDKATRIANAKMPIDGLSMSDDAVIYNGESFGILSDGQKIRVSTAIAMALNPTLRLIFIRRGSELDSSGRKEIAALAKEKGYMVWMEVVDETGEVGYYIEDGSITKIKGQAVPAATTGESHEGDASGNKV